MTAIGETLRRERQRRNLELGEISRELKISHKFLEAIEAERFDELPGGVFVKSFVRQYAHLLGLDEEELAGEVQRTLETSPANLRFAGQSRQSAPSEIHVPPVEAWQTMSDSRYSRSSPLPSLAMVALVMLLCSGVYAWWQRARRVVPAHDDVSAQSQTTAQSTPAEAPQPQTPSTEAVVQPSATTPEANPAQSAQAPPAAQGTADRPAPDAANPPATALPGASTRPAPSAPSQESASQAGIPASNPNAPVQVAVTADEPVWILARADGKFSFSGTLEANQTRTVEGNATVLLRLGNAGGVSITLNGKPVGAVGPKGQVRTVQFTSGGFQIVAAPKPSLPLDDIL